MTPLVKEGTKMKRLILFLLAVVVFASQANAQTFPVFQLGGGEPNRGVELRLLSLEVPQSSWDLSGNVESWATINFETDRKPEIRRACFNFSGDGQSCVDVQAKDVTYGSHPRFRVPIHVPVGTKRINCYAEYIRDGNPDQTNIITYIVIVLKKPEE